MLTKIFVGIRVCIGIIIIVSGFEKLIVPYQNFLYVVQSYSFLPTWLEDIVSRILPWGELLLGVFVVLGLWLKVSLRALAVLFIMFMGIVGQAYVRGLPIDECGCFGQLISLPLYGVFIFDSVLLVLTTLMIKNELHSGQYSLDRYLSN